MAQLFPSEENILKLKVQPTLGEFNLLKSLKNILKEKDDFEIYYQPFLNGDQPDLIIMRKGYGVLILEVKDWDLSSYYIDDQKQWRLKKSNAIIKSPIAQVKTYKDNLYNLHIEGLLEKKIDNNKFYGIVSCGVYLHKVNQEQINKFLENSFESQNDKRYVKVFGIDSLTPEKVKFILSEQRLFTPSNVFDNELYESFKRYLQPPSNVLYQGKRFNLTKEQQELAKSEVTIKGRKILGVAGSGKTQILAQRAVNAYKRTDDKILILTYNITLKNYIHDKISQIRENCAWNNFYINNYHAFMKAQFNNLGIKIVLPSNSENLSNDEKEHHLDSKYYSNENIFDDYKDEIIKYQVILIDELQDYKEEWQKIIRKYFWAEGGEYVVFGDAKQNIYSRELDANKDFKAVDIPSQGKKLNKTFRLSTRITNLALKFQKIFFTGKYVIDEDINSTYHQASIFNNNSISNYKYLYYQKTQQDTEVFAEIYSYLDWLGTHPNDVCILSSNISILREFDHFIRHNKHEKTTTMFESKELYEKLNSENKNSQADIETIRKNKKLHFWMNAGTVKLSTIHSFKGWEIDTLVLIVTNNNDFDKNNDDNFAIDELLYTAITRCRKNLIVVNIENNRYHSFFFNYFENNLTQSG